MKERKLNVVNVRKILSYFKTCLKQSLLCTYLNLYAFKYLNKIYGHTYDRLGTLSLLISKFIR